MTYFNWLSAPFLCLSATALLTACGGTTSTSNVVTALPENTVGLSGLRFNVIDSDESGSGGNFLYREDNGENTINVIDADTIEYVTTEFGAERALTFNFNEDTGFWEWDAGGATPVQFEMESKGSDYFVFSLTDESDGFVVEGGFGIATNLMPNLDTVTYSSDASSRILARSSTAGVGDSNFSISSNDGVRLEVNFMNGSLAGTVFDGFGLVDLDDDGALDDRIELVVDIAGNVSGSGFTATVSGGAASFDLDDDGVGSETAVFTLSNTDADGTFYGSNAGLVSGTWEGDYSFVTTSNGTLTGEALGRFDVLAD